VLADKAEERGLGTRLQEQRSRGEELRSCFRRSFCNCTDRVSTVGNAGHKRRAEDARADAGLAQAGERANAQIRPWRARFEKAGEPSAHGSDGQMQGEFVALRNFLEQIDVARNQGGFGDDSKAESSLSREDLQQGARDALRSLQGLIGICSCAQCDLGAGFQLRKFLVEEPGRVFLEVDLVLELVGIPDLQELVGETGITITAGELTTAVGIDGMGEGQSAPGDGFAEDGAGGDGTILGEAAGGVQGREGGGLGEGREGRRAENGEESLSFRHIFAYAT
jgi:hypothetical protein